jgi:CRP-like cAMP-binding protein
MRIDDQVRQQGGNGLLAALPPGVWSALRPHLELTRLRNAEVLCEQGSPGRYAHFPLRGTLVSLSVSLKRIGRADAATIGAEGVVNGIVSGLRHPSYISASVQIGGDCVRIPISALEEVKERSPALREVLSRYADALLAQLLQALVCNMLHPAEKRFARWLLTTHDRMTSDELPLTQENIAQMLGVHRSTVIRVAQPLQARGVIDYSRGSITIIDRSKLERAACECYSAVSRHYSRILLGGDGQSRSRAKGKPGGHGS